MANDQNNPTKDEDIFQHLSQAHLQYPMAWKDHKSGTMD